MIDDETPRLLGPSEWSSEVADFGWARVRVTWYRGKMCGIEWWDGTGYNVMKDQTRMKDRT